MKKESFLYRLTTDNSIFPTVFAIRHKNTGYYLPDTRRGTGRSYVEPTNPNDPSYRPRLFTSRVSAERTLTSWLQGHHVIAWEDGGPYVGHIEYQKHRSREDMEIIEFKLKEIIP
ncbi:hypothetical protein PP742_gp62 [Alcaligenes phage vB_Af_QDWS595]|uniref:Uncharacterized protein n=1 Tax=Alcaligenes phage vB_Af_QDWS595 TaxID=2877946 RepID=A0AAE8Y1F9_9CAUD|nr:hypothetical protein PP742_gp62 [Alcaligenes phage vB_Af_QDWS595]UCR75546.1 hypothetical protein vBAfaPQDWS595_62 [Alcaligenes phage vB_Af_QDWS595]